MNFYEKTNFYALLFILFLGCPLNSMWFKKMPKVKFSKAKTFMSLAATVATIKIKNTELREPSVKQKKINADEEIAKTIEISDVNCPSDAFLADLQNQGLEISCNTYEKKEKIAAIINKILEKERALAKDYYVFYHGQKGVWRCLQDAMTKIHNELYDEQYKDLLLLRNPVTNSDKKHSPQSFLEAFPPAMYDDCYDCDEDVYERILSVNLSLFGNSDEYGVGRGECTLNYFLTNYSCNYSAGKTQKILHDFFIKHNLSKNYIDKLLLCNRMIKKGNLIQICIPKKDVGRYTYISFADGIPILNDQSIKKILSKHPSQEVLSSLPYSDVRRIVSSKIGTLDPTSGEMYQCSLVDEREILSRYPNQEDFESMPYLQARIVLSSGVLDPNSGVKMYQYSLANEEDLSSYDQELNALVSEIVEFSPQKFKKEKAAVQAKYAYLKDEIDAEYAEWKKNRKKV